MAAVAGEKPSLYVVKMSFPVRHGWKNRSKTIKLKLNFGTHSSFESYKEDDFTDLEESVDSYLPSDYIIDGYPKIDRILGPEELVGKDWYDFIEIPVIIAL
jgi:hypothetical protein